MTKVARRTVSNQSYQTPWWLFVELQKRWEFTLDAAASHENALLPRYLTAEADALTHPWDKVTFCNPPYRDIGPWLMRGIHQAYTDMCTTVFLVPATFETQWYREHHIYARSEIIYPRVNFCTATGIVAGVPTASQLFIVDPVTTSRLASLHTPRVSFVEYRKPKVLPPDARWAYRSKK